MSLAERWHDFYLLTGAAAATLAGLVFVALALRPEVLSDPAQPGAQAHARQIFGHFVGALLLSIVVLVPGQSAGLLGVEIVLAGALGVVTTIGRVRRIVAGGSAGRPRLAPLLAIGAGQATLMIGGGALVLGQDGLYLVGLGIAVVLMLAFVSVWQIVVPAGRRA